MAPTTGTQVCVAKNCVHKLKTNADDKADKKSKRKRRHQKKEESESESSESEDSSSVSEDSGSDESSSSSDSSSEEEVQIRKSKKNKSKGKVIVKTSKSTKDKTKPTKSKSKKIPDINYDLEDDDETGSSRSSADESGSDGIADLKKELETKGLLKSSSKGGKLLKSILKLAAKKDLNDDAQSVVSERVEVSSKKSKKAAEKVTSKAKYKRLDEIWDESVRDYRLKETNDKKEEDQWEKYVFTVRRKFNCENRYQQTIVEIKSVALKDCLKVVMDGVEGISLVEKTPKLMPDMLFLYLEDFRSYVDVLDAARRKSDDKKARKTLRTKAKHLGALVKYLDRDYDEMKKTLYPMVENGTITFELLWALYKPNSLAYCTAYGDDNQPRAFRISSAYKERDCVRGPYYDVEGKSFDYDGEKFGPTFIAAEVFHFQGARKITSLPCYPLKYHPNAEALKLKLIERGKRFLSLAGMKYKFCQGTSYVKKEKKILKANINGRVMIDPKTFRRINPNYPLSDVEYREIEDENKKCRCDQEDTPPQAKPTESRLFMINELEDKEVEIMEMMSTDPRAPENITDIVKRAEAAKKTFTEEELLLASPLLPGFSFSEKLWVELPVSSISEVQWNDGAFDSLMIPEQHKSIVKALVTAHGQHASKGIDDVVSGKGKGLVAVLHGKPGLGKTLTCEAISDLLKRPLYSVTAGDLGTNASHLEIHLQTILDVAHSWNAVLLLDEADVFLEERSTHDVHRNAMVSVFLRMLEYFSGILMMTTNRVETFDDAFVSRIHLSLRYSELTVPARKAIWKTFITKVAEAAAASSPTAPPSETSSAGMPTPETTSSTPNSGASTPAPPEESSENPPATPTTPISSRSSVSIESADSDQTITPPVASTITESPTAAATSPAPIGIEKITEANYAELARIDLNGRQIKNLVKTAQALALYEGVPMGMGHLRRCIEVGRSFEMDLKGGGRGWEDVMRSYM